MKKCIRILFYISFVLAVEKPCFAQLTVDIGKDTVYCAGLYFDTLYMRDGIIVENGTEPYTYAWECTQKLADILIFTASDFLNDTTIPNPYFKDWPLKGGEVDWLKFYLHVTDSEGAYGMDSINIGFSNCAACPTGDNVIYINQGDSILLDAGSPYGKYCKFYWEPAYGLSDPDSSVTWCKPEVSTSYSIVQIDTFGCTCSCSVYDIRVIPVSIDESNLEQDNRLEIIQTGTMVSFSNPLHLEASISLYSANGCAIISFKTIADHFDIAGLLKTEGIYFVFIKIGKLTYKNKIINF
jgi:hypothetical protein